MTIINWYVIIYFNYLLVKPVRDKENIIVNYVLDKKIDIRSRRRLLEFDNRTSKKIDTDSRSRQKNHPSTVKNRQFQTEKF